MVCLTFCEVRGWLVLNRLVLIAGSNHSHVGMWYKERKKEMYRLTICLDTMSVAVTAYTSYYLYAAFAGIFSVALVATVAVAISILSGVPLVALATCVNHNAHNALGHGAR